MCKGKASVDRATKDTLPLTAPYTRIKSSTKDYCKEVKRFRWKVRRARMLRSASPRGKIGRILRLILLINPLEQPSILSMDSDLEAFSRNPPGDSIGAITDP